MTQPTRIILSVIGGLIAFGAILFSGAPQKMLSGSFNPTGGNTYLLQSSISATQSTITLTSFTEPGSGTPYTMSYINTDVVYGTISPSSGNSEFVSFTGITQNANSTATLSGVVRGLARTPGTGGCVASTTLAHAYPGQTQFILSNSPCFYGEYAVKKNDEYIRGQWTYQSTTSPHYLWNPSATLWTSLASTTFASKGYVDSQVTAGCSDANTTTKGCVEIATALEAASSTTNGGTGAIIVYGNGMATDTPTMTTASASKIAMSDLTGYLKQGWLKLTESFTFSGGLWSSASTTIKASNITTGALTLNGFPYAFPVSQSASSSVLSTNGSGTLTWNTLKVTTLSVVSTFVVTSSSGDNILKTVVIPANTLSANSGIRYHAVFGQDNGPGTCTFKAFLGTGSATTTIGKVANTATDGSAVIDGMIMGINNNATSTALGMSMGDAGRSTAFAGLGTVTNATSTYSFASQLYLAFSGDSGSTQGCTYLGSAVEVLSQ